MLDYKAHELDTMKNNRIKKDCLFRKENGICLFWSDKSPEHCRPEKDFKGCVGYTPKEKSNE